MTLEAAINREDTSGDQVVEVGGEESLDEDSSDSGGRRRVEGSTRAREVVVLMASIRATTNAVDSVVNDEYRRAQPVRQTVCLEVAVEQLQRVQFQITRSSRGRIKTTESGLSHPQPCTHPRHCSQYPTPFYPASDHSFQHPTHDESMYKIPCICAFDPIQLFSSYHHPTLHFHSLTALIAHHNHDSP